MKKCMLIALITIFTLSAFGASCFADTMANTSKKGSLLIYPLFKYGALPYKDTIITISNDSPRPVDLHCVYKVEGKCTCEGFAIPLTPSQPFSWLISTGKGVDSKGAKGISKVQIPSGSPGELKCWAVDSNGQPISHNWLSGTATILESATESWEYRGWVFAVGGAVRDHEIVPNSSVNNHHQLLLTGKQDAYDACPSHLLLNFIEQADLTTAIFPPNNTSSDNGPYQRVNNVVTLVPCKQDCTTTDNGVVYTQLTRYNEEQLPCYTDTCVGCQGNGWFYSENLASSKITLPTCFTDLGTPGGMLIVDGRDPNPPSCQGATVGAPLIGVSSIQFTSTLGPIGGETVTGLSPPQGYLTDQNGISILTQPVSIQY